MSGSPESFNQSHRRRNPLTGDWILVSPHRNNRPWQGQLEPADHAQAPSYDPDCYLCPGNERMSSVRNPSYADTHVFDNDFAALSESTPEYAQDDPLFSAHAEQGHCRVICYSPDHGKTLAELADHDIAAVVRCWIAQYESLASRFEWIQIFENKGAAMGCSMPHPHGQVWAQAHAPTLLQRESDQQSEYYQTHSRPLLLDYAEREIADGSRVVINNEDWLVVVPFWAAWPFETLLLPRFSATRMPELSPEQQLSLAQILRELLVRYDNLFECSFPYSMGWHGAPMDARNHTEWQLHAHFYPPLLRSATVRKFMVGYEMMTEPQRDLTAEQAAARLREVSDTHYKQTSSPASKDS